MKNLNVIYRQINELMDLIQKVKEVLEVDGFTAFKIVNGWVNDNEDDDKEVKENNVFNITLNCDNGNNEFSKTIMESLKKMGK